MHPESWLIITWAQASRYELASVVNVVLLTIGVLTNLKELPRCLAISRDYVIDVANLVAMSLLCTVMHWLYEDICPV